MGEKEVAALKVIEIPRDKSEIELLKSDGYDQKGIEEYYHNILMQVVNEYRTMRDLKDNPSIVRCEDFQYIPNENDIGWTVFIRMELLTPLRDWLNDHKEYDEAEVIKLAIGICGALSEMEKRNLIHRDVSPKNIFISPNGYYKLGDLGIATVLDDTAIMARAGTMNYMAPETYTNNTVSFSTDIYSLGLTMYWLMNDCRHPYLSRISTAEERGEALFRRMRGDTIPQPKNGSQELKTIVLKACSFDAEMRYKNADEMLAAIYEAYSYSDEIPWYIYKSEIPISSGRQSLKTEVKTGLFQADDNLETFYTDFGTCSATPGYGLEDFKEDHSKDTVQAKNDNTKDKQEMIERALARDTEALIAAFMLNLKMGE